MNHSKALVLSSARLAERLIRELHERDPDNVTFDQVGLLDGGRMVADYLEQHELGCAVHHLLYMIHESDIMFPSERVAALHRLAARIGARNGYSRESLATLTPAQRRRVFNSI